MNICIICNNVYDVYCQYCEPEKYNQYIIDNKPEEPEISVEFVDDVPRDNIEYSDYSDDSTDVESNIDLSDININNEVDGEINEPVDSFDDRIIRIDDLNNDIKPGYYVFIGDLEYEPKKLTEEGKKWAEMASEYMKNNELKDMQETVEPDIVVDDIQETVEPDIVVDDMQETVEDMEEKVEDMDSQNIDNIIKNMKQGSDNELINLEDYIGDNELMDLISKANISKSIKSITPL